MPVTQRVTGGSSMFTSEQVKQAFGTAQAKAAAKAKEFEAEARKVLEALGDRAQAELKVLISTARSDTRDRIAELGAELEKLGRKVQELARTPAAASKEPQAAESGPNGAQPPVN
jgi:predicted trehalose synthase